jgi:hypothetical protein
MNRDRRGFMAHLRRIYKEDREPEIKELRSELKKRRMEFYTRDDGRKTLVLVHSTHWRKSKSPQGRDWPDYFKTWNDDKEDCYETLLVWSELLGGDPEATVELLKDFVTDDEEEESEGLPYIQ